MKRTKKVTAAVITALMAVTMMQIPVFAETDQSQETKDPQVLSSEELAEETGLTDNQESTEPSSSENAQDPADPTDPTDPTEPTDPTQPTTEAPAVPAVRVLRDGPGLKATWNMIAGADYYEVYRSYQSGTRGSLLKKVTNKTAYKDTAVASGKRAYYTVRAHKSVGGFTAFSKQASNVIYRVYIETGHGIDARGRWDSGCTWKKYQEAKLMIPIAKATVRYLRSKGVYVYTDAYSGNNRNLKWLLKNLKGYHVSVLVNIHCDYKGAPKGSLALYRYSEQKKLALCLTKGVHKTVKLKNRGMKKRKDLESLNKTKSYCVACLFETGNIKKDNKVLRKKSDAYGKGLAMGVCSYLGVKW